MKLNSLQLILVILMGAIGFIGCRQSVERRLNLKYTAPQIPSDLEQWYAPAENEKAIEYLREGETQIDMHRLVLWSHRNGWDCAISDFNSNGERQFNSVIDVYGAVQNMEVGCDAFWLGCDDAWKQVEAASNR